MTPTKNKPARSKKVICDKEKSNKPKVIYDKELIQELLIEMDSVKTALSEIKYQLSKLNKIEENLQKGEVLATTREGWFLWSS